MTVSTVSHLGRAILGAALIAILPVRALANPAPQMQAALAALETAEVSYDRVQLQLAIDALSKLASTNPQNPEYGYYLARAHFPLINLYDWSGDGKRAQEVGNKGIQYLEAAIKAGGDGNADAYRLLGDFYGRMSFFQGIFGRMRYGSRSTTYHKKAFDRAPGDYRTIIGVGTDKLYAPSAFGGDIPGAVELFKKAIAIDPKAPAAYVWLGKAYLKQANFESARQQFQRAREIAPGSGMVRGEWEAASREHAELASVKQTTRQ